MKKLIALFLSIMMLASISASFAEENYLDQPPAARGYDYSSDGRIFAVCGGS